MINELVYVVHYNDLLVNCNLLLIYLVKYY